MVKKDITQFTLSKKTGFSQSQLSNIMNGKDLYLSTAQEIAMAVGEKVDYIWPD